MDAKLETMNAIPDGIKWLAAAALIAAGVFAFHFYAEQSLLLRVVVLLLIIGASGAVALQTEKGRIGWDFVRESRTEVRKVVWPTRKETLQTTGIVIAMVSLVAIMLWMLDSFLGWLLRVLLGQGS